MSGLLHLAQRAVDDALGEVCRQCGDLGSQVITEARGAMGAGTVLLLLEHEEHKQDADLARLRAENEALTAALHTSCGSCGTPTEPDIRVCPKCLDAWIAGKGCEFLDKAQAPLREENERLRAIIDGQASTYARLEIIEAAAKAWISACDEGKHGTKCSDYAASLTRCNRAADALRAALAPAASIEEEETP